MLELDFAFLNIMDQNRTGLAGKKVFLDKLAPLFFAPQLKKIIKIPYLQAWGGNIMLPLGLGNLRDLQPANKDILAGKLDSLLQEYQPRFLAVDRRLKNQAADLVYGKPAVYGDNFIKTLAHVIIKDLLKRYELRRIIIVGSSEDFPGFISSLEQYNLPISLQAMHPQQQEIFTRHLLYEKGQAVSTSYLNPQNWASDDLIIVFADWAKSMIDRQNAGLTIYLNDGSSCFASRLQGGLEFNGLFPALYNIAPILESCLLVKAGIQNGGNENITVNTSQAELLILENIGCQWGLWDLFLDKA